MAGVKIFRKGMKALTGWEREAFDKALDEAGEFGEVRKPDKGELAKILSGTTNRGGVKVPPKKVRSTFLEGGRREREAMDKASTFGMPSIVRNSDDSIRQKIYEHARMERSPKYDVASEPVFGPADAAKTKAMVPQRSIASELPPKPSGDQRLPANDRSRFILENEEEIARELVRKMQSSPHADNPLPFYSTGSVLEGLQDIGKLSPDQSMVFMRDWAGQGAGTSPRTATPQNMRNASYLMDLRHQGTPLTPDQQQADRASAKYGFPGSHNQPSKSGEAPVANLNRPGFAMMGMHTGLSDEFANEMVDPWKNPKPFTFRENWSGNMADVTADTHNIRAVLDAYDQLEPGGIPREWFKSEDAFRRYVEGGGFPKEGGLPVGDINDKLSGQMIDGRKGQTEYPIIQGPTKRAAEMMDISPAEAQERLWFDMGSRTGLQSPRQAIPDLLNSQIEATAKATGLHPEVILRLWAQRRIPLAANEQDNSMPGASAVG